MNRRLAWSTHAAVLLVGGTGLLFACMIYLMSPVDEFSVVNHPLQPTVQAMHLATAPFLVFCLGLLFSSHIWKHFRTRVRSRRGSGLAMLVMILPMVASGGLIQISVEPFWRTLWVGLHVSSSAVFVVGYLLHMAVAMVGSLRSRSSSTHVRSVSGAG